MSNKAEQMIKEFDRCIHEIIPILGPAQAAQGGRRISSEFMTIERFVVFCLGGNAVTLLLYYRPKENLWYIGSSYLIELEVNPKNMTEVIVDVLRNQVSFWKK